MKRIIILAVAIMAFIVETSLSQAPQYRKIDVFENGNYTGVYGNGSIVYINPSVNSLTFRRESGYWDFGNANSTWEIDGNTVSVGIPSYNMSISSCDEHTVTLELIPSVRITITIVRIPTPTISGSGRLCEGQSGNFSTQYYGGINYNWSGTGGMSVSPNSYEAFASLNSPFGTISCTASNQCGSRADTKSMGVPNENEFGLYNIPYSVNPNENYTLNSLNNSTWTTYYGYFNNEPWNQSAFGQSVNYRTVDSPMNVVYVTQSNSCGSNTTYITMWRNGNGYGYNENGNEEIKEEIKLDVFPNPTSTTLSLQLPPEVSGSLGKKGISIPEKIALYDKSGNMVKNVADFQLREMTSNQKVTIDVKDLIPNEYYLHITDKRGKVEKVRVLIGDKN